MTDQSGIVRRPDFAGGGITEEERERIAAQLALWIQRAFRTEPADPRLIERAIKGLYRAANFAEPRVIVVPSPAVMKIAGGIALTWWYLFENQLFGAKPDLENQLFGANEEPGVATTWHHFASTSWTAFQTHSATVDATRAATSAAIDDATSAAIGDARWRATRDTTGFAAEPAIDELTEAEIDDTIYLAAYDATRDATYGAIGAEELTGFDPAVQFAEVVSLPLRDEVEVWTWFDLAVRFVGRDWAQVAVETAEDWDWDYLNGNMAAPTACYLSAARDIIGLRLPSHEAYAHWEQASINGGVRWMHHRFCLVSDFPPVLRVNARNQPHAEFGPSHRWRDGYSMWRLNGVRVERWMAESHPVEMDARRVIQIGNVNQRREVIRRMGIERLVAQLEAKVLDTETREIDGKYELLAIDMNHGEPWRFLKMVNQSNGAVHVEAVPRECHTVREALNWRRAENMNHDWFLNQLTY